STLDHSLAVSFQNDDNLHLCRTSMPMKLPFALLLLMVPALSLADEPTTRPAVPPGVALRKAVTQVDQIYRQEFAKAREPQAKMALAKKILDAGRDEQNPENKYALLNKS